MHEQGHNFQGCLGKENAEVVEQMPTPSVDFLHTVLPNSILQLPLAHVLRQQSGLEWLKAALLVPCWPLSLCKTDVKPLAMAISSSSRYPRLPEISATNKVCPNAVSFRVVRGTLQLQIQRNFSPIAPSPLHGLWQSVGELLPAAAGWHAVAALQCKSMKVDVSDRCPPKHRMDQQIIEIQNTETEQLSVSNFCGFLSLPLCMCAYGLECACCCFEACMCALMIPII